MQNRDLSLSRRDFLRTVALAAGSCAASHDLRAQPTTNDSSTQGYIDAHVHVWTPDRQRYPLAPGYNRQRMANPSFTPDELFAHTRPCGVRRIVLIQMSYYGFDNSYMLDTLRAHKGVFSAVARVEETANVSEAMRKLARQGVRGFRIVSGNETPDRWLGSQPMDAIWKCGAEENLAICALTNPPYLPAIDAMCQKHPGTSVVLDHFARIGSDGQVRPADLENLCRLARHKNVYVKVSAFYALGKKQAPYLDLGPMIRRLLDAFGPQRLMWASDSPFQVMRGHCYRDSIDLIRQRLDFLGAADRDWLLRRTAERMFFA